MGSKVANLVMSDCWEASSSTGECVLHCEIVATITFQRLFGWYPAIPQGQRIVEGGCVQREAMVLEGKDCEPSRGALLHDQLPSVVGQVGGCRVYHLSYSFLCFTCWWCGLVLHLVCNDVIAIFLGLSEDVICEGHGDK